MDQERCFTPLFFCAIITRLYVGAYVLSIPRLSDAEIEYRNLCKAAQRRVADAKRKRKERIEQYNERTFNQLELDLVRWPNQRKWLLSRMRE